MSAQAASHNVFTVTRMLFRAEGTGGQNQKLPLPSSPGKPCQSPGMPDRGWELHPCGRDQHRHLPQARRPRGPGLPVLTGARADRQLALGDPQLFPKPLRSSAARCSAKIASASGSGGRPSITNAFATAITPRDTGNSGLSG
jgi:hypothetical protein